MKDENIHVGRMLGEMLRYWKIYIPIGLACLIGAIIFILMVPKQYTITSSIQLLEREEGLTSELKMLKSSGLAAFMGGSKLGVNMEDEMIIMKSRRILTSVIREQNLQIETRLRKGWKKVRLYGEDMPVELLLPHQFTDTVSYPVKLDMTLRENNTVDINLKSKLLKKTIRIRNANLPLDIPTPLGNFYIRSRQGASFSGDMKLDIKIIPLQTIYENLGDELDIREAEAMSDIIVLRIDEQHRELGKDLLNLLMAEYNLYSRGVKIDKTEINARFVKQKLDSISYDLATLEYQVERYMKENDLPNLEIYGEMLSKGYLDMEKDLLAMHTQVRMLDYVLEYLRHPDNQFSAVPLIEGSGEKAIEVYNKFILERMRLLQSSEPENPMLILVNEQLREQRKILIEAIQASREGVHIALEELNKKNNMYMSLFTKLPTQEREFIEIKRQQRIKEAIFLFLMQKLQEKELVNAPDEQAGRVIDVAYASAKAVFPRKIIVLAVAFVIACFLSSIVIGIKMYVMDKKH